ncbi:MAG: ATP-binding protein [Planctomycetota bacterium]
METQEPQGSAFVLLDDAGRILFSTGEGIPGILSVLDGARGKKMDDAAVANGTGLVLGGFLRNFAAQNRRYDSTILQGRDRDGAERLFRARMFRVENAGPISGAMSLVDITGSSKAAYQLAMLRRVGDLVQGTLELNKILYLILTCVTAGFAIGFNRAFLFLVDPDSKVLQGRMAVGPRSLEEAGRIWNDLSRSAKGLDTFLNDYETGQAPLEQPLKGLVESLSSPLSDDTEIIVRVLQERRPIVVRRASQDPRITEKFRRIYQAEEFAAVPLLARNEPIGVILVDNIFSGHPITDEHVQLLATFATPASLAVQNAAAYERLQRQMVALKETQDRLIHSERLATIGKLAAHISHEIRNPLVTIGGFARLLQRAPEKVDDVKEKARIIVEEVSRLEEMLSTVMDFAKPAAPQLEPAELNTLVEQVARFIEGEMKGRGILLKRELSPDLPLLLIDFAQVKQVFLNLIQNAADATSGEGIIQLKTYRRGARTIAEVTDNGTGIASEDLQKIFEPFFTKRWGGTGLGLAVSRKIMEDHGGRIEVESAVGKGTTMRLVFVHTKAVPMPGIANA